MFIIPFADNKLELRYHQEPFIDIRNILLKTVGDDDQNHFLKVNHSEFKTFAAALPNLMEKMENGESEMKIDIVHLGGSSSGMYVESDNICADITPTRLHLYKHCYSHYNGFDELMNGRHTSILEYLPLTINQLQKLIEVCEKFENVHHAMCSTAGV
jgi:hypothetical protein